MDRLQLSARPVDALCDDIVERYHASLQRSLPLIHDAITALAANASSPVIDMMRLAFAELADRIYANLAKEENLLFPALEALSRADRAGTGCPPMPFATVLHPIRVMEIEHLRIEDALDQLREFALEVSEPDTLTPAWRHCMADLQRLGGELREHHCIENEVLFPAALDLERRLV